MLFRVDVDRADQAAVLAESEIGSGANMGVVEAQARGFGDERNSAGTVGRDERAAFFGGSVDVAGDGLSVPVDLFGRVGVVAYVDRYRLPFFQAQQWAGELSVVRGDGENALGGDFEERGGDRESVVDRLGVRILR